MGSQAVANYDNVVETDTGEKLVKLALDTWGRLDIVINNAGILRDRMIFNMATEDWDAVIAVHLRGHYNVARPACAYFRQERKGGVIVNTSSTSGLGNLGQTNYAAAKEGIVGFTRTLAREMGRYGVRCQRDPAHGGHPHDPQPRHARSRRACRRGGHEDAGRRWRRARFQSRSARWSPGSAATKRRTSTAATSWCATATSASTPSRR